MKRIGVCIEWDRAWGRDVCEGICAFAQKHPDWSLTLMKIADVGRRAIPAGMDGLIVHVPSESLEDLLCSRRCPVVDLACRTRYDARTLRGHWQDNAAIGRLAARHFIEHRFASFAFCGYDGQAFSDIRKRAFVRTLERHRHSVETYSCDRSVTSGFVSAAMYGEERIDSAPDSPRLVRWLQSLAKPVAVFCANDLRALQAILACEKAGISVPDEVAVLGVDNDTLICNFITPTISSIDPDAKAIGVAAAESLACALDGRPEGRAIQAVRPRELVTRASSDVFSVEPRWLSDALVFIRRNINRSLSAADVYAAANRSHTSVDAAFRRALGASVLSTIRSVALDEAKRLLAATGLPISEVSKRTGFRSPQYFCNVFSGAFGMSPSAFREAGKRFS